MARTSFACLQMSSDLVQAWQGLSKETCEEQEVEMDIIMEWRDFHGGSAAATHSDQLRSHLSQPVSALEPTEAVQSRRFRKTCVKPPTILPFNKLHCVLNLDEFGPSTTRLFKRNMWRAGSGDGHHMEWREFHGGSAAATHNDQL